MGSLRNVELALGCLPLRQCATARVGLPVCWFHFPSLGSALIPLRRSSAYFLLALAPQHSSRQGPFDLILLELPAKSKANNTMGDVSSLAASMQAQQAQLAERILSQLSGQQGPSSQDTPKKQQPRKQPAPPPQAPRRGHAGVGAESSSGQPGATMVDPRLKGRLTKRKATDDGDATRAVRKKHATEAKDEPSRDQMVQRTEKKGKKKDVFDVAASKIPPKPASTPVPLEEAGMSKAQRKKLRKKQRLSAGPADAPPTTQTAQRPEQPESQPEPEAAQAAPQEDVSMEQHSEPADPYAQSAPAQQATSPPSASAPKRTKLQDQMSASLAGARFRSINETLYTTTTQEALRLMQEEPDTMADYHEGFASQTRKWPVNPVLRIADRIRQLVNGKGGKNSRKPMTVADLGAGTAPLAREFAQDVWVAVLSYDLLDSEDGMVVGCDVGTRIPLPGRKGLLSERVQATGKDLVAHSSGVVDVAVFCLSLMGTNWVDMLLEARRVLKHNGTLLVAEVTSRLVSNQEFTKLITSLGFDLRMADEQSKAFFTLFEFQKNEGKLVHPSWLKDPDWEAVHKQQRAHQDGLVQKSEALLKPCIYKRR